MHGSSTLHEDRLETNKSLYFGMEDSYFPYINDEQTVVDSNDNIIPVSNIDYQIVPENSSKALNENSVYEDATPVELTEVTIH